MSPQSSSCVQNAPHTSNLLDVSKSMSSPLWCSMWQPPRTAMAQKPAAVAIAVRREELWPRRAFRKCGRFMAISKVGRRIGPSEPSAVPKRQCSGTASISTRNWGSRGWRAGGPFRGSLQVSARCSGGRSSAPARFLAQREARSPPAKNRTVCAILAALGKNRAARRVWRERFGSPRAQSHRRGKRGRAAVPKCLRYRPHCPAEGS